MAQNSRFDDDLPDDLDIDETNVVIEEIPEIPKPKKASTRKKSAQPKTAAAKEFDIRAAHQAWKEKNDIDDSYPW